MVSETTVEQQQKTRSQTDSYGAKDITVLEGLEAVRKRPGMYIGSTGLAGIQHLIYEIVDNSVDEAMAGYATAVNVTINADGSVTVSDNGRGIPVDTHKRTGKSALETVLTTLHAGGKFGDKGYQVSGGLHGVGASVVNALSDWLEVEVRRDAKLYTMKFERGAVTQSLQESPDPAESPSTGTRISWMPDKTIFSEIEYDFQMITQRFKEMAYLNPGFKINFTSNWHREAMWPNNSVSYYFDGGVKAFVRNLNRNRKPLGSNVFYVSQVHEGVIVDVAMQYNESFVETCASFANCIRTNDGGSHVTGFRSALTRIINDWVKKKNLLKNAASSVTGEDVREGLVSVISVKVKDPQFEGQTKGRLGNPEVKGYVEQVVGRALSEFLEDNPNELDLVLNKALTAATAREAAKKARDLVHRKNAMDGGSLPGKLSDCTEKEPRKSELFLVEGESAGGSAKLGRERYFQAILPLKGKILNVERARIEKMLSHEEIAALISAVGTGIGEDFDLERLRYHKIIIMTDADVDGSHIRTLLLTFFFRNMQDLINNGNLYIAQPPLYKVSKGRSSKWIYTEQELDEHLADKFYANVTVTPSSEPSKAFQVARVRTEMAQLREYLGLVDKLGFSGLDDTALADKMTAAEPPAEAAPPPPPPPTPPPAQPAEPPSTGAPMSLFDVDTVNQDQPEPPSNGVEPDAAPPQPLIAPPPESRNLVRARKLHEQISKFAYGRTFNISKSGEEVASNVPWRELPQRLEKAADRQGISIQRYKGLGEMNPDQLWETTMDPDRRLILKVDVLDANNADEVFRNLMGEDVEPRRNFIKTNALDVRNLDI